jgi:hypothetical protein
MSTLRTLRVLALGLLAAGCAELLPRSQAEVNSPWHSYEEARAAIERIVPGKTSAAELSAMGVDPGTTPNVRVLSYSDILLRFPMGTGAPQGLDEGLRQCLAAGKACSGYFIDVRDVNRDRVGDFWLDMLRFKREVEISGWNFNALILMVDGRAVYALHGGQPAVREHEVTRNPLGPLQEFGDALRVR